jgi:hypothetical protein
MSSTLPRTANSLNSFSMLAPFAYRLKNMCQPVSLRSYIVPVSGGNSGLLAMRNKTCPMALAFSRLAYRLLSARG